MSTIIIIILLFITTKLILIANKTRILIYRIQNGSRCIELEVYNMPRKRQNAHNFA